MILKIGFWGQNDDFYVNSNIYYRKNIFYFLFKKSLQILNVCNTI